MSDDDNDAALAAQQQNEQERQMTLHTKLAQIQQSLNAPKTQTNKFGGYNYRSCEDILMAVKPLLGDLILTITDEIEMVGDRFYIRAVARLTDGKDAITTTAYAREPLDKKGADASQITGAASSYARKYALNGLLLIDDNKDADATNDHGKQPAKQELPAFDFKHALDCIKDCDTLDGLKKIFAAAWAAANEKQKPIIKKSYDERKALFETEQETA